MMMATGSALAEHATDMCHYQFRRHAYMKEWIKLLLELKENIAAYKQGLLVIRALVPVDYKTN